MGAAPASEQETLEDLLRHFDELGTDAMARELFGTTGGSLAAAMRKTKDLLRAARSLRSIGVELLQDVRCRPPEAIEATLRGAGPHAARLLLMYTGDDDFVRGDTHVRRFVASAIGRRSVRADGAEALVRAAAHELILAPPFPRLPHLAARRLRGGSGPSPRTRAGEPGSLTAVAAVHERSTHGIRTDPSAAGARPDAFGIDDDLESALLAGLADPPEESDGPALGTSSAPDGPPGGTVGVRIAALDTGASAAAPLRRSIRRVPMARTDCVSGSLASIARTRRPRPFRTSPPHRPSASRKHPTERFRLLPPRYPRTETRPPNPPSPARTRSAWPKRPKPRPTARTPGPGFDPRTDPEARFEDRHGAGTAEIGSGSTDDPDAGPDPDAPGFDAPDFEDLLQGLSDAPAFREGDPGTPGASSPEPEIGSETGSRTGNGVEAEPAHDHSALANWASPAFSPDPALEQAPP